MEEAVELTVVIPTRSRSRRLARCLNSVLAQEEVSIEVIVVDDASSDDTPRVLSEALDGRVQTIVLDSPNGVATARNIGMAHARGSWVAFIDDDDLWAPWKLRCQLDAAREQSGDFAFGAGVVLDDDGRILRFGRPPLPLGLRETLLRRNVIPGGCSNVIAKTELVLSLGGFDPELTQLADRDLWIRLAEAGNAAVCQRLVVAYRVHPGNMRYRPNLNGVSELEYLLVKHGVHRRRKVLHEARIVGYRYFARAQLDAGLRIRAARIFALLALRERSLSDLVRAIAVVVVAKVRRRRAPWKPRVTELIAEIDWLRGRTPAEVAWLTALTLERLGLPSSREATQPAARRPEGSVLMHGD